MNNTTSSSNKCEQNKRDGQRCRANVTTGSKFCYFHNPDKASERTAARRKGGIARSQRIAVLPPGTPDRDLKSSRDVADLLRDVVNKTLRGELDPKIGYVVGHLTPLLMTALQKSTAENAFPIAELLGKLSPEKS